MGTNVIETETYATDQCDLYAAERNILLGHLVDNQVTLSPNTPISTLIQNSLTNTPRTTRILARFASAIVRKRSELEKQLPRP